MLINNIIFFSQRYSLGQTRFGMYAISHGNQTAATNNRTYYIQASIVRRLTRDVILTIRAHILRMTFIRTINFNSYVLLIHLYAYDKMCDVMKKLSDQGAVGLRTLLCFRTNNHIMNPNPMKLSFLHSTCQS